MSGQEPLKIGYHDGEYLSGYTAFGVSAEIIEELHCGKEIEGWGFHIDKEFEDGNLNRMLAHAKLKNEKIEKIRKEKEDLLAGVSWETRDDEKGGMLRLDCESYVWKYFISEKEWKVIRPLTENEKKHISL